MALPSIYDKVIIDQLIERINQLNSNTPPTWGKMSVGQMLAHCNVTYEMIYDNKHPKPNGLVKLMLKLFVKNKVINEQIYPKDAQTAPAFIINETKDFDAEKKILIDNLHKVQTSGDGFFDGRESHSFGPLNKTEWNNMMYKHLDHHLRQFGV
jgi:hypothetical protein